MSTPTPRLLKDLAEREAGEDGSKESNENGNGNGKPANGAPKPLVVTETPKGPRLTDAATKVVKPAAKAVKVAPQKNGAAPRVTKMSKAKEIFKKLAGKGRKEVLAALMKDAKLTRAGAQTYYYLLLKKK